MQAPTIRALKTHFPSSITTVWVAPRGTRELAEHDPYVNEVIEAPIKTELSRHMKNVVALRKTSFSAGIVLSPGQLLKSAAYLRLAGIPVRIGHAYPFRSNPNSSFLLTNAIQEKKDLHDIEQNLQLLSPLGIQRLESAKNDYSLTIPASDTEKAHRILTSMAQTDVVTLIGMHPGSAPGYEWKRWPLERFADVAAHFIRRNNVHILVFGGPEEKSLKQRLRNIIGVHHATIVASSLLSTAAIMQKCRFVLSNDSGLMHLAAASGAPTFGLFGPTDERLTGPRGKKGYVLRAAGTHPVYSTETVNNFGASPHPSLSALTSQQVIDSLYKSDHLLFRKA